MESSPEQIKCIFEKVPVLEEIVTKLRAQVAALTRILQTTPGLDGTSVLGGMKQWQRYEHECKLQEENIRKDKIL
jgi:tetrahydromethanopterin S-methyltransferase subunit B